MLSSPSVTLTVIPEPKSIVLTCEGKTYSMNRIGTQWTTILKGVTEGVHQIDVKPEGASSVQCEIKIVGISGETNINDMFDL